MNRNEEFYSYKAELEAIPTSLDSAALKAIKRVKKHRKHSLLWQAPSFSILSTAALFVLLVNLFPAVALAMSNIPFLEDLVAAVAFDPGLKTAVENDYVQIIGEHQTQDNVTVSVEYMILDAGHISIFFQVDAPVKAGQWHYDFRDEQGNGLAAAISFDTMYESGKLEKIDIDYLDGREIPKEITFHAFISVDPDFQEVQTATYDPSTGEYTDSAQSNAAGKDYAFVFDLYPDEGFRKNIVSLPIHQWLALKDQRIYLDCLNVYPTQARLLIEADPENSALLKGLNITFMDEKGTTYDSKSNGITGTFDTSGLNMNSLFYESSYFSDAEHLKLIINGISILDKDKLYGLVQYDTKSITNMPAGVSVRSMDLDNTTLKLTLDAVYEDDHFKASTFDSQYYDINGKEYFFTSFGSSANEEQHVLSSDYTIKDFKDHYYKLRWNYAPMQLLEEPIELSIK